MKADRWKCAGMIIRWAPAIVYALPGVLGWLEFDRVKVMSGQAWRLVTCQWTHWSVDHLLWDALAFIVLGVMCERMDRKKYWITVLASAILIPLAVWVWIPGLRTFRGLSGIDSALFALLAVMVLKARIAQRAWKWVAGLGVVAGLFFGKIVYEVATGDTIFVDSAGAGMIPVPLAHVVGAVIGMGVGMRGDGVIEVRMSPVNRMEWRQRVTRIIPTTATATSAATEIEIDTSSSV